MTFHTFGLLAHARFEQRHPNEPSATSPPKVTAAGTLSALQPAITAQLGAALMPLSVRARTPEGLAPSWAGTLSSATFAANQMLDLAVATRQNRTPRPLPSALGLVLGFAALLKLIPVPLSTLGATLIQSGSGPQIPAGQTCTGFLGVAATASGNASQRPNPRMCGAVLMPTCPPQRLQLLHQHQHLLRHGSAVAVLGGPGLLVTSAASLTLLLSKNALIFEPNLLQRPFVLIWERVCALRLRLQQL